MFPHGIDSKAELRRAGSSGYARELVLGVAEYSFSNTAVDGVTL